MAPPRLRTLEESERTATWLELFYDLAFVAAVAMMGTRLVHEVTWAGIAAYLAYFVLVWWLWASHTFYADRYDTDDLIYRLLAGAQMVAVAVIAVSVSVGEAGSTQAFAIGYTAARFILLALYARAFRHVPETRELVRGLPRWFRDGVPDLVRLDHGSRTGPVLALGRSARGRSGDPLCPAQNSGCGTARRIPSPRTIRSLHDPGPGGIDRGRHRRVEPRPMALVDDTRRDIRTRNGDVSLVDHLR